MPRPFDRFTSIWPLVNGRRMHTLVSPHPTATDATPIVLVHGLGVSSRYMAPTAERLCPFHPVFVPDLPGFGKSDKPSQALDIPALADALVTWLAAVGLSRAAFLGNSLGCQVIVDLAVRYPATIDRAILVGPTVDTVGRTFARQLWRGCRDLLGEPWSLWPILAKDYFDSGTIRILRTIQYTLNDPVERKFPIVHAPTLIVRGGRDTLVPQRWAEEIVGLLPRGQLAVIPHGTHAANYSAPDELSQIVLRFVQ